MRGGAFTVNTGTTIINELLVWEVTDQIINFLLSERRSDQCPTNPNIDSIE